MNTYHQLWAEDWFMTLACIGMIAFAFGLALVIVAAPLAKMFRKDED